MGDRRDIGDLHHAEPDGIQCTNCRLASRARALYADFDVFHAIFLSRAAGFLRRNLGCERGALARSAKSTTTRRRPGQSIALPIGDRDDRVVERSMDVRDRIRNLLLYLLFRPWLCHINQPAKKASSLLKRKTDYLRIGRRGPFRVRALVRVR